MKDCFFFLSPLLHFRTTQDRKYSGSTQKVLPVLSSGDQKKRKKDEQLGEI